MNGCADFHFHNSTNANYNSVSRTLRGCAENLNFLNLLSSYFGTSSFPCSPRLCTTRKRASSPTLTIQAFRSPKPNSVSGGPPALLKSYWVGPTPLTAGQDQRRGEVGTREDDVTGAGRDLRLLWALRPLRVLTEDRSVGDAVGYDHLSVLPSRPVPLWRPVLERTSRRRGCGRRTAAAALR